ncbi:Na/Pi cotransporter family protein [Thalassotalea mangrovi]|uniref:Na/Pi cotransporter family protein n=1 Tax=Thalassotalea mangrovi TaxID=2572245 RepID=A0A4U1B6Z5_9GAMM|nr:Na/Pi symporter [Thalassotalea mangrovi]TKB45957.1 Na/Pi cotransporter family protein [Thalassotalea mangrovi]
MELLTTLGGLGLFLLGMGIMTRALKAITGRQIKRILSDLTKSPVSAVTFGALTTALLQSSSATTIAAVGFVSAEIISFTSSLGIIFGANLGTTITGWLVALFGFKFKIGSLVYPLLFTGALLNLLAHKKLAQLGLVMAGFALVFLGISLMQSGMTGMQDLLTFDNFPGDSWLSRLQLIGFGILFTIVTQSSSAGIAATLTALNADLIVFEQAAALAIGMDIGTTATAALATIGGSVNAKRTGFSHVIYNLMTATMAFFLISPFIEAADQFFPELLNQDPELALVAFHSGFNLLGVILVIPFTHKFARFMKKVIPSKPNEHNRFLDNALLANPDLALVAVNKSLNSHLMVLLDILEIQLMRRDIDFDLVRLQSSLDECHRYIDKIHLTPANNVLWNQLLAAIHIIDHLQRLHERCEEDAQRAVTASNWQELAEARINLITFINNFRDCFNDKNANSWKLVSEEALTLSTSVENLQLRLRQEIAENIGSGQMDITQGTQYLEATRWFARVCYHLHRISSRMTQLHMSNQ